MIGPRVIRLLAMLLALGALPDDFPDGPDDSLRSLQSDHLGLVLLALLVLRQAARVVDVDLAHLASVAADPVVQRIGVSPHFLLVGGLIRTGRALCHGWGLRGPGSSWPGVGVLLGLR